MSILQLLEGMATMAVLLALTLGLPVSAYLFLKRLPRRFVWWPIIFAATAGAFSQVIQLVWYIVIGPHRR